MYLASCMYQIHTCWLPEKGFSMSMTKNKSKKHIYMFVLKKCYIITFLYIVVFLCLCSRYVIQIDITCQSSRRTCMRTPGEGIPFDAIQNSKPVVAGISSGLSHPYGTSKLDQIFWGCAVCRLYFLNITQCLLNTGSTLEGEGWMASNLANRLLHFNQTKLSRCSSPFPLFTPPLWTRSGCPRFQPVLSCASSSPSLRPRGRL